MTAGLCSHVLELPFSSFYPSLSACLQELFCFPLEQVFLSFDPLCPEAVASVINAPDRKASFRLPAGGKTDGQLHRILLSYGKGSGP